jgi:hypothetical protein
MIECRDAVRGHKQQRVSDCIKIAYFAAAEQGRVAEIRRKQCGHWWSPCLWWELNLRLSSEIQPLSMHLSQQSLHAAGGVPSCRIGSEKDRKIPEKPGFKNKRTSVTAVTDPQSLMGETSFVNMVQRACTKVLLEPGDTRQQWKGEAATSLG